MVQEAELADIAIAAAAGDLTAWRRIVDRFAPLVWSVARSYALAAVVALDVGQICWLRLTEALDDVRPDDLGCWLAAGVRAEALHALRWNDPRWDTTTRTHLSPEVLRALEQLPARSRVAVELHGLPGIGPRELGAALGLPPEAARELAEEALRRMDVEGAAAALRMPEPVPPALVTAALASYSWRAPDADVAGAAYDSLLDEQLSVRSSGSSRLLTFAWGDDELDLEVLPAGGRRTLVGRFAAAPQGPLLVRHGGVHELRIDLDGSSTFTADDLAPGALSVVLDLDSRAPRRTDWVLI